MSQKILVSIEAMPARLDLLNRGATSRGVHLVILAENPSLYATPGVDLDIRRFNTGSASALAHFLGHEATSVAGVFSNTSKWSLMAARSAELLGLPGPSSESVTRLADKHWARGCLHAAGIEPSPAMHFSDWQEDSRGPMPCIVKPAVGTGSRGVFQIRDKATAAAVTSVIGSCADQYVVEPYFDGPVYSAEVYVYRGKPSVLGFTNRTISPEPYFVEEVKSFPHMVGTGWEATMSHWVEGVIKALGIFSGFCHIEFADTLYGPRFIEVNARLGGALVGPSILASLGYDPYDRLVADALGEDEGPVPRHDPIAGFSHTSVYADRVGTFRTVSGLGRLANFPGELTWWPSKCPGERVASVGDYRARLGHLSSTAETAPRAQDFVAAGLRVLDFVMEE